MEKNKIFYISDTHFRHTNVLKFDNRPFDTIEQMEEQIINNWNNTVNKGDRVYILGDFCWSRETQVWKNLLNTLNGAKHLIMGNHDAKRLPSEVKALFQDIKEYKEIKDGDREVIMCHYPILFYKRGMDINKYMLYGHVHKTNEYNVLQEYIQNAKSRDMYNKGTYQGNLINVGCMMDYMNYTPRTLDELIKEIKNV